MIRALAIRGSLVGTSVLASAPAQAAGIEYPVETALVLALCALIWLGVPAAGFGYLLGHFFGMRVTLLITAALASLPLLVLWPARNAPGWNEGAGVMAFPLLALSVLVWLGWRIAAKELARQRAHETLNADLRNG